MLTRTIMLTWAALSLAIVCASSCGGGHAGPRASDGGWTGTDLDAWTYAPTDLSGVPDGLPDDPAGPSISIISPKPGETVLSELLTVKARITDPDAVDSTSVTVTVQGQMSSPMAQVAADTYQGLSDVSEVRGGGRLWVIASDTGGHTRTAVLEFSRDAGPVVTFLSPKPGGHYKGSVDVQVVVQDVTPLASFDAVIGSHNLNLKKTSTSPTQAVYGGTVVFDSPFDPPLSGAQVIVVTATNLHQAKTVAQQPFVVDNEGPAIQVIGIAPGDILGGPVKLEAEVTDGAGVNPVSVKCVVGNGDGVKTVQLSPSGPSKTRYEGLFDSLTFPSSQLWPVLSFRAADVLGNESHVDLQVGLDNAAPIVELDSKGRVFVGRYHKGAFQCSHPIDDPVGKDAANDLDRVPQIVPLRVRVEDQGNPVASAKFVPVALIDDSTVKLYVLDATEKPLVVDATGDGYCDSINPDVVPLASAPQAGRAIAVDLAPVPLGGASDFRPYGTFPFAACSDGEDETPPDPLCRITGDANLTRAIFPPGIAVPAIYTIPPVVPASELTCLGLPFDFAANGISNGWACVAVAATDRAGNRGVSPPLRLWFDQNAVQKEPAPNPGSAPNCTGTLNPATKVVDATKPCLFRGAGQPFAQRFLPDTLIVE
jgi:hypothetical protein